MKLLSTISPPKIYFDINNKQTCFVFFSNPTKVNLLIPPAVSGLVSGTVYID